jgi:hypothetical protein
LSSPSRLRLFYLLYLSKPASDRVIYREIRRHKARKIVELGIGAAQRSRRMIEMAAQFQPARDIHYTGIDLFEDRQGCEVPGISLKAAHQLLKPTGARIQLAPGAPHDGLARIANSLGKVDLIVLSPWPDAKCLASAWFYIPRLLHDQTVVLLETLQPGEETSLRMVDRAEIEMLAAVPRRRAA